MNLTRSSTTLSCSASSSWPFTRSTRRSSPVFLIHGGADDAGHRNPDPFAAAKQPKQIWDARGGHTDGIAKQPAEYGRRVVDFLDGSLLGR